MKCDAQCIDADELGGAGIVVAGLEVVGARLSIGVLISEAEGNRDTGVESDHLAVGAVAIGRHHVARYPNLPDSMTSLRTMMI